MNIPRISRRRGSIICAVGICLAITVTAIVRGQVGSISIARISANVGTRLPAMWVSVAIHRSSRSGRARRGEPAILSRVELAIATIPERGLDKMSFDKDVIVALAIESRPSLQSRFTSSILDDGRDCVGIGNLNHLNAFNGTKRTEQGVEILNLREQHGR